MKNQLIVKYQHYAILRICIKINKKKSVSTHFEEKIAQSTPCGWEMKQCGSCITAGLVHHQAAWPEGSARRGRPCAGRRRGTCRDGHVRTAAAGRWRG